MFIVEQCEAYEGGSVLTMFSSKIKALTYITGLTKIKKDKWQNRKPDQYNVSTVEQIWTTNLQLIYLHKITEI